MVPNKYLYLEPLVMVPNKIFYWEQLVMVPTDLEKAASGASGACGHFVGDHAILRTFCISYPVILSKDGERRVEDG